MSQLKKEPLRNVVSIRVSDAEKRAIEELTSKNGTTISTLLREVLGRFALPAEDDQEKDTFRWGR